MPFLQAALNGDREPPAAPRTPDEIDQRAVGIEAGLLSVDEHDPRSE
jgi:hypothetical protein